MRAGGNSRCEENFPGVHVTHLCYTALAAAFAAFASSAAAELALYAREPKMLLPTRTLVEPH